MVDPVDIIKTYKHDKVAGLRVEGLGVGQAAVKTFQLKNNSKLAKKMHFNGQNRKKLRKQTLIIFQFYMNIYMQQLLDEND